MARAQLPGAQGELLRRAVEAHKGKSWKRGAEYFEGRTDVQCLHRWHKVLNPELVKGPWAKRCNAAFDHGTLSRH